VRLGKWPLMARFATSLPDYAAKAGLTVAPLTAEVAVLAGSLDWPHRDPFDRLLAATALVNGWQLLSADPVFDSLTGLRRVW
jgi:PIN domain nuclease of toxin-antitoxin system